MLIVLIMRILTWLLMIAEILLALPILYLCLLSVAAVFSEHRRKVAQTKRSNSAATTPASCADFAILVPAHNEESVIEMVLESLSRLNYRKDCYTVYVVADNCSDRTAELVREHGREHNRVQVYERVDAVKRGKGYALNWMLQRLAEDKLQHDAYIILDADSVVKPDFLLSMNRELARGGQALQACNTVLNVTDSPGTALRWLALTLVNHVRSLGRTRLGGSSTLNGNGMCLSHALLTRYPWQAFGQAEDYQYYLTIVEHGERVVYVPDAVVRSQMPATFAQMRTQDIRWESSSGSQSTWHAVGTLLKAGLQQRDYVRIEAVAELLTPPLSLLVSWCMLTFVLSLFIRPWSGLLISTLLVGGLLCYIGTAFYLLRPPQAVYKALLHAPGFVLWKLWVYFVLKRSRKHAGEWVRTSRA
ncbi:MAG: glycosyltransferase family 2 protein [Ktedonobacteraceae bacterium]